MRTFPHIISNVGADASFAKRIWANIVFHTALIPVRWRDSLLTHHDYESVLEHLTPGDIVLVGQERRVSHWCIGTTATHAALFVGDDRCVHAYADGVEMVSLADLIAEYDTLIIARPTSVTDEQRHEAVRFAHAQIGKPFDYTFQRASATEWYCSRLITEAFEHAGAPLNIRVHARIIRPLHLLSGNVDVVYRSRTVRFIPQSRLTLSPVA